MKRTAQILILLAMAPLLMGGGNGGGLPPEGTFPALTGPTYTAFIQVFGLDRHQFADPHGFRITLMRPGQEPLTVGGSTNFPIPEFATNRFCCGPLAGEPYPSEDKYISAGVAGEPITLMNLTYFRFVNTSHDVPGTGKTTGRFLTRNNALSNWMSCATVGALFGSVFGTNCGSGLFPQPVITNASQIACTPAPTAAHPERADLSFEAIIQFLHALPAR